MSVRCGLFEHEKHAIPRKEKRKEMQSKTMEFDFLGCDEPTEGKSSSQIKDWMGREMHCRSSEHQEAYKRLTFRQQQYIAAYLAHKSPSKIAVELNLESSPKTIGKTLRKICDRMGVERVPMLVDKEDKASATSAALKQMIEQQGYRCALSGEKLTPSNATLDHRIPVSDGGSSELDNLQWLHVDVNRMKGSLDQERFIQICKRVTEWAR